MFLILVARVCSLAYNERHEGHTMVELLTSEVETYERHREELLGQAEGKFVLICRDEIAGVFDTEEDAVRQGYERFGNVPFLVKQIVKVETPQNFVSNLLAV